MKVEDQVREIEDNQVSLPTFQPTRESLTHEKSSNLSSPVKEEKQLSDVKQVNESSDGD